MSINIFTNYPLSWRPDKHQLKKPLAINLVKQMKHDIEKGLLLPGTKLPPQRELADYLDIGFSTVTRAYKISQEQGLTFGKIGQGTFIANNANTPITLTRNNASSIAELGFVASFESTSNLAWPTIQELAQQSNLTQLLNYDSPTGMASQKAIANQYLQQIGMTVNQQNIFIASGGENALTITLASLFHSGSCIAVDQFTFANFIEMARLFGIKLIPIKSDNQGMLPNELALACQRQKIDGIYLMPDCNNPTTIMITNQRRRELAKMIKDYQLILLEDDYLSFLNLYRVKPMLKMSTLLPQQSVYISSMSKPLISGLRVSFVCVADQYRQKFEQTMLTLNVKTSALDAEIICQLLENGTAVQIMRKKLKLLQQNNTVFDQVFATTSPVPTFFRVLPLQTTLPGEKIENYLLANNIRVFHSDRFLIGHDFGHKFLRVSLSAIDHPHELANTLNKLKSLLQVKNYLLN